MTRYHSINGENIAFTPEEETARNEEEAFEIANKDFYL